MGWASLTVSFFLLWGFLLLRASLPGTTVTPDLKIPKDPGYLMLMSNLELSHCKMFPHKGRGDLLLSLCCQDFDRESELRHFFMHLHTFVLRFPNLNFWVSCFGRAAMSSEFPTRCSLGHLDRWRKYLTYWKYKDILKELGAGVQLQGFAGFVEASGVGVLRNWVSRGLYWAFDPADRYIAAFVTAWLWWKWQVPYW